MRLRPFRSSDLETLYAIDQSCFPPAVAYSRSELARFVGHRGSKTWIAAEGDAIVGFLIAHRGLGKAGYIVTIDVIQSKRRGGIGSRLMDAAEAWARQQGLESMSLETAEENLAALEFYAARGYERIEKRQDYYGPGQAAWHMVKSL